MRVLLDTNIIVRAAQPALPEWPLIDNSLSELINQKAALCIVPQTIYEFWVVATRPASQNGFGLDPNDAKSLIDSTLDQFTLLRDERGIFDLWSDLVTVHQVSGKGAHDARLVAAMQRHSIANLVTFNEADFKRFPINVLTPRSILAGATLF
jgi:predicted nucleic acid-binding protein